LFWFVFVAFFFRSFLKWSPSEMVPLLFPFVCWVFEFFPLKWSRGGRPFVGVCYWSLQS